MAATLAAAVTSAAVKAAIPPAAATARTVSSPAARCASATTTRAPSAANASAAARPMPPPPPVMTAVRPASRPAMVISILRSRSCPLEVPPPFPRRHRLVELPLLGAREVDEVLDHLGAEGLAEERRALELRGRLRQRAGHLRQALGLVDVGREQRRRLEAARQPVEAGREGGGEDEVGIGVRTRDATLDPQRAAVADDAEARGAVVVRPGDPGRRERPRLVALVGVDIRREEQRRRPGVRDKTAEPPAKLVRDARAGAGDRTLALEQRRRAVGRPEARVDVHGAPRPALVELRHEGERQVLLIGDLLGGLLVEDVAVGHLERVGVTDVDLVLAGTPLALGELDRHARGLEVMADGADQRLHLPALQRMVVLEVPAEGLEVVEALALGGSVGVAQHEELELRGGHDAHARGGRALDLPLEDGARRHGHERVALLLDDVAEDDRRVLEPGRAAERREVRHAAYVTVALLPRGEAIAGDGVHLHAAGEEVVP